MNFDVVLVTAEDLHDKLLREGNLREVFAAVQRADAVVVRVGDVDIAAGIDSDSCRGIELRGGCGAVIAAEAFDSVSGDGGDGAGVEKPVLLGEIGSAGESECDLSGG